MTGELRMITDLSVVAPKELAFNYEELKEFLTEALQEYKTLVVTEDAIPEAKAKRAKLNKLADNLDSYRINVKKQLMEVYDNDFAPKVNELKAMTKEASDNIANQIKAFEETEKAAKMAELKAYYDSCENAEAKEYCPWERVANPKWANKTYSAEDAKEEIRTALYNTEVNLESIRTMGEEDAAYLLTVYKDTRDINAVIRKRSELIQAREREEQRKREEEERRKAEEEAKAKRKAEEQKAAADFFAEEEPRDNPDPLITIAFEVVCKQSQLAGLGDYMKRNGIVYRRA
jgi:hypothetical protein